MKTNACHVSWLPWEGRGMGPLVTREHHQLFSWVKLVSVFTESTSNYQHLNKYQSRTNQRYKKNIKILWLTKLKNHNIGRTYKSTIDLSEWPTHMSLPCLNHQGQVLWKTLQTQYNTIYQKCNNNALSDLFQGISYDLSANIKPTSQNDTLFISDRASSPS